MAMMITMTVTVDRGFRSRPMAGSTPLVDVVSPSPPGVPLVSSSASVAGAVVISIVVVIGSFVGLRGAEVKRVVGVGVTNGVITLSSKRVVVVSIPVFIIEEESTIIFGGVVADALVKVGRD